MVTVSGKKRPSPRTASGWLLASLSLLAIVMPGLSPATASADALVSAAAGAVVLLSVIVGSDALLATEVEVRQRMASSSRASFP